MNAKTTKTFLLLLIITLSLQTAKSCDCIEPYGQYFCENIGEEHYIVMAVITDSLDYDQRQISILENIHNEISTNEVLLLGGDGANCGLDLDLFSIGDTLILALLKFPDDAYFLHGDCWLFYLSYSNGQVTGSLTPDIESIPYEDFVADFMTCMNFTTSSREIETNPINVFPNPFHNRFVLELNEPVDQVEIMTISGQKIYAIHEPTQGIQSIDLSEFSNGIYIVSVRLEGRDYALRIVKN